VNDLIERPTTQEHDINIRITFVNGDVFEQPLTMNEMDGVQDLMDWFRDTKGTPVWTWHVPSISELHMLNRAHIMGIDIDGYIEPDGKDSRWYERLADKVQTFLYFAWRKAGNSFLKGGEHIGKSNTEKRENEHEAV
jgi:hypothetical protein